MTVALKAAIAAHMADRGIKLVHIWRNGKCFNAMLEWPDTGKPVRHETGAGDDEIGATLRALQRLGFGGFTMRCFLLTYLLGLSARPVGKK